jgi:rhomboid protease GluP
VNQQNSQDPNIAGDTAPQRKPQPPRITIPAPTSTPYVTYIFMGLSIFVYLLQIGSQYTLGYDLPANFGAKVNQYIVAGELWRLITPILLHGSIVHMGFNMYALYLFGPRLESNFGHWRFLALYLISGFAGNVFSLMFTEAPSLGSSTAIFGLLGAHGIFVYQNREFFGPQVTRTALGRIIQVAVINLLIGLSPSIDNWGHVGGLIGGTVFTWFGGPLLKVVGIYPNLAIKDERENSEILQAIAIAGGFFIFLVTGALYLMSR